MNPPLLDVLGAQWDLRAPVVGVCWGSDDGTVGFAMGDGRLAVADTQWRSGPRVEPRAGGGLTLRAADQPAPEPQPIVCHGGSCHAVAAHPAGGFVTGGDDGRVLRSHATGRQEPLAEVAGSWIDAVACSRTGAVAHAGGRRVELLLPGGERRELQLAVSATALAFAPDGRALAIAHVGGVTVWDGDGAPRELAWPGYHRALAWSPDGRFVVSGMQENAVHGWRVADGGDIEMGGYMGQPLSLSFSAEGRLLVTSGGLRPVCWDFARPGSAPAECGIASKAPVSCVACHPRANVIAVGHHSGAVTLCQPGGDAFLLLKGAGGVSVSALSWSGNGQRIAFGTEGGPFGWLELPDAIFRGRTSSAAAPRPMTQEVTQ
jgi:WD40 repeat protein